MLPSAQSCSPQTCKVKWSNEGVPFYLTPNLAFYLFPAVNSHFFLGYTRIDDELQKIEGFFPFSGAYEFVGLLAFIRVFFKLWNSPDRDRTRFLWWNRVFWGNICLYIHEKFVTKIRQNLHLKKFVGLKKMHIYMFFAYIWHFLKHYFNFNGLLALAVNRGRLLSSLWSLNLLRVLTSYRCESPSSQTWWIPKTCRTDWAWDP